MKGELLGNRILAYTPYTFNKKRGRPVLILLPNLYLLIDSVYKYLFFMPSFLILFSAKAAIQSQLSTRNNKICQKPQGTLIKQSIHYVHCICLLLLL